MTRRPPKIRPASIFLAASLCLVLWPGGADAQNCTSLSCSASAPASALAGQRVQFVGGSATDFLCTLTPTYSWDFGDGSAAFIDRPQKDYSSPGTYTWTLTVSVPGAPNCVKSGTIEILPSPCSIRCSATAPATGKIGQPVSFQSSAQVTGPACGTPTYRWDFGDGTFSTAPNPGKTYGLPGTYSWTLTVNAANASPCISKGSIDVTADCTLTCNAGAAPVEAEVGQDVLFTASYSAVGCNGIPVYSWTFGDGGTSGAEDPLHTYSQPGSYAWRLTIVVPGSLPCTKGGTVNVVAPGLSLSPRSLSLPAGGSGSLRATLTSRAGQAGVPLKVVSSNEAAVSVGGSATIPAGSAFVDVPVSAVGPGSSTISVSLPEAFGAAEAQATVTVAAACPEPPATELRPLPRGVTAGKSFVATWQASGDEQGLREATYLVELSVDGFETVARRLLTREKGVLVETEPSGKDYTLSVRVRSVIARCKTEGPLSEARTIPVEGATPRFVFVQAGLALDGFVAGTPPGGLLRIRNVGGQAGRVTFLALGGFFSVAPQTLDLGPGETGDLTITATSRAMDRAGVQLGTLVAAFSGDVTTTQVSLAVTPERLEPGSRDGVRLSASPGRVVFRAPKGQDPEPQTIELAVTSLKPGAGVAYLAPRVGPGGAWLLMEGPLAVPTTPDRIVTYTLSVDRTRRSSREGSSFVRTFLELRVLEGGEAATAVVEVVDVEDGDVAIGTGPRPAEPPASGTSFLLPVVVNALGAGGTHFTTDCWISNPSEADARATLFFTLDGQDGAADPASARATLTVPSGETVRLVDVVGQALRRTGSGQLEIRTDAAASLSVRSTVEAVTGGDSKARYGAEIPVATYGAGVAAGEGEWVIPAVSDDGASRTNLILAETTGRPATATISLNDAGGALLGLLDVSVPAFGKAQVSRFVAATVADTLLTGGWAGVSVTDGNGRVLPLVTVIDNRSASFSAVLGRAPRTAQDLARAAVPPAAFISAGSSGAAGGISAGSSGAAGGISAASSGAAGVTACPASAGRSPLGEGDIPTRFVIPTVVRSTGAFDTQYTTSLYIANGVKSDAFLQLTYDYYDLDDGGASKIATAEVTIPGRGALDPKVGNDVLSELFGVSARSYGSILIEGDVASCLAVASISALVDAEDPEQGVKTAQVEGTYLDAPAIVEAGVEARRFAGCEKSVQKRTNLVLLEVGGGSCEVRVRLHSQSGDLLGERTYAVEGSQYFQVNDIFGPEGIDLGEGPFQNVQVSTDIVSGDGRVIAVTTVNDNISKSPGIYMLQPPAYVTGVIGF